MSINLDYITREFINQYAPSEDTIKFLQCTRSKVWRVKWVDCPDKTWYCIKYFHNHFGKEFIFVFDNINIGQTRPCWTIDGAAVKFELMGEAMPFRQFIPFLNEFMKNYKEQVIC